jgi:hypothetical protein
MTDTLLPIHDIIDQNYFRSRGADISDTEFLKDYYEWRSANKGKSLPESVKLMLVRDQRRRQDMAAAEKVALAAAAAVVSAAPEKEKQPKRQVAKASA